MAVTERDLRFMQSRSNQATQRMIPRPPTSATTFRTTSTALPEDFRIEPRPFSPEIQRAFEELQRLIRRAPITERDILESPSFQAMEQAIRFSQGEREAALRRDLASRGILRSTPAVQAFRAEAARSDAAIASAIPQLLEAARAREQQAIRNLFDLISTRAGLEEQAFGQALREFGALAPFRFQTPGERFAQAAQEAAITGRFLPPDVHDMFMQVIDLKREAESGVSPQRLQELTRAADEIRAMIAARGFDPSIVGPDVSAAQALRNIGQAGVMPLSVRQALAELTGTDPVTGRPLPTPTAAGGGGVGGPTPTATLNALIDIARLTGQITPELAQAFQQFGLPVRPMEFPDPQQEIDNALAVVDAYLARVNWPRANVPAMRRFLLSQAETALRNGEISRAAYNAVVRYINQKLPETETERLQREGIEESRAMIR